MGDEDTFFVKEINNKPFYFNLTDDEKNLTLSSNDNTNTPKKISIRNQIIKSPKTNVKKAKPYSMDFSNEVYYMSSQKETKRQKMLEN